MTLRRFRLSAALLIASAQAAAATTTESALPLTATAAPEISEAIRSAETAEEQKDWRSAAFHWQQVLAREDHALHPAGPRHAVRALDLAAERLAAWPAEGRSVYEEMYGAQARDLAARFYATGDARALVACVERFPASAAARDQIEKAALLHFEAGRFRTTAALCERIRREAPERSPAVRHLAEACRRLSVGADGAERGVPDAPSPAPRFEFPCLIPLPATAGDPDRSDTFTVARDHSGLLWILSPSRTTAVDIATGRTLRSQTHAAAGKSRPWDPPAGCLANGRLVRPLGRSLTALDLRTGETVWTLPLAPREFVSSRPSACGNTVFAVSVIESEPGENGESATFLLRVDAEEGRLRARIPISRVFRDPMEGIGALAPPPILTDRCLVCDDGLGTLAGIDPESERLLWTSSCDLLDDAAFEAARVRGERWRTSFLRQAPDGNAVIFASAGTGFLQAVSAEDGRPLWSVPRGTGESILGISGGEIWIAGRREVRRLAAATGALLAVSAMTDETIGPGYLARDGERTLAIVPVLTGIASVTPGEKAIPLCRWPGPTPSFAAVTPDAVLFERSLLLLNVNADAGGAKGDPLSGVHGSMMRGDSASAARAIVAAAEGSRTGSDPERVSLLAAYLARLLLDGPDGADPLSERLIRLVSSDETRAELLLRLAAVRAKAGRVEEAVRLLDTLLDPALRDIPFRSRGIPVPLGEWARAGLARLAAPARLSAILGDPYRAAREKARTALNPQELLDFFLRYPLMPEASADLADAARRAAAAGNGHLAEEAWTILAAHPAWRAEALEGIAALQVARGNFHSALHAWKERLRMPGAPPSVPVVRPAAPPYAGLNDAPPPVDPRALLWHVRTAEFSEPIERVWTAGPLLLTAGGGSLTRRDPETGGIMWRSPIGNPDSLFFVPAGNGTPALLVSRALELMRLDPDTGRPLWLLSIPPTGGDAEGPPTPDHPDRGRTLKFNFNVEKPSPDRIRGICPDGETLIVQIDARRCVGIAASTGNFLWDRIWEDPLSLLPGANGAGTRGATGRFLHRLDPDTGVTRTRADLPLPVAQARLLPGNPSRAWVSGGSRVALIEGSRGTAVWERDISPGIVRGMSFDLHETLAAVLVESGGNLTLSGIDGANGAVLWTKALPGKDPVAWRFAQQDLLVAWIEGQRLVACRIDAKTGGEIWRYPLGGAGRPLESPRIEVSGTNAFLHDPTLPVVVCFDAASGERGQDLTVFGRGVRSLGLVSGIVVIHGERGLAAYGRLEGVRLPPEPDLDLLPPERLAELAERAGAWHAATGFWREALAAAPEADAARIRNRMESSRVLAFRVDPPVVRAVRFARPPEIDGRLTDGWAEEARVDLASPDCLEDLPRGAAWPWQGPPDLSARLYAGWDDEFLYLALDASDQKGILFDEEQGFSRGDSLLVHVNPEDDRGFEPAGGDRMVGLALQNPVFAPVRRAERPPGRYAVAPKPQGGGSIYEAAIPWTWLRGRGIGPGPGSGSGKEKRPVLGIGLVLTDDDGEGVKRVLTLSPGMLLRPFAGPDASPAVPLESPSPALFARLILDE